MTNDLFVVVVSVVRVAYVSVDAFDVPPVDMLLLEPYPGVPLAAEQVPLYSEFGAYRAANAHRCFWHEQRRARPDRCLRDVMFEVWTAQAAVCCGQVMGPLSWAQWSRMG